MILDVDPPVVGQVRCSSDGDETLVELSGEIDMACDDQFTLALRALADRPPADVVVDLGGVTFFGAAGLRFVAEVRQVLARTGRDLRIANPSRAATKLLDITGLAARR
ncbi:STAS domain-containing protein [Saccharothrix sp. Mg75]|uniref:STAS domain-containing protein n=1 Tax=Saccharothrix sp. Mg75 TaxID=3445357 RepID=UPI003EEE81ED